MERMFTERKVWDAINSMGRGKSPGRDGFILEFYVNRWKEIKEPIMAEMKMIYDYGIVPKEWKEIILIMIPKVEKPKKVIEYRLIALCNVIYKIFAKMLVNRIRNTLKIVIGKEQYAFTPERNMHDSILLVNEIVHKTNKSKAKFPVIIIKIDLEKAYDRVDWRVVVKIMKLMGYLEKVIRWISNCMEGISYCYKINGVNSRHFESKKGLRQGDPLSPYLFIILEQLLSEMMNVAVKERKIDSFMFEENVISHTLFADDIVFFIKGNSKSCKNLKTLLSEYCSISGQKLNLSKSEVIFPSNTCIQTKQLVKNILNIK
ncbi:hypothetical protein Cni_G28516 [Canna indica]|uniref:Reverse transcriptase domain-containing protein n=1 Tax=Canna indica TaxID=4628 RepID=A0AAQ3L354_9LILI|nr:hypothetical protein Cni_G28516 [Canna indica]